MSVFDALVGQQHVVSALRDAARDAARFVAAEHEGREAPRGAMTHAWLFTGPPGSGRSVAAWALAAALLCDTAAAGGVPGCGACPACERVRHHSHEDVWALATEGLSISVDTVRSELVPRAVTTPVSGRWRILVVEDADRLISTSESAANALLKTLEEPAPRTVIMLCCPSPEDLLPTLVSRCRRVGLRQPPTADVAAVLQAEGVDAAQAFWAARAAQGHVGRARRLATDPDARSRRAEVLSLPTQLQTLAHAVAAAGVLAGAAKEEAERLSAGRDEQETAELKAALGVTGGRGGTPRGTAGMLAELGAEQKRRSTRVQRDELDRALVDLAALYRDVLALQFGVPGTLAIHGDLTATTAKLARGTTPERTLQRIEAVLAAREAVAANSNPQIVLEALALSLR
ncbi:MAG TPA: DNA polymerase III subunit delta' [Frankiaceae bacterium]